MSKLTKQEILDMVEEMIKNVDNLPRYAMSAPITHIDYHSLLLLLSAILRLD